MKFTEINEKSAAELTALLKEKRTQLFTLKVKQKTMQLQNTSELRGIKKDIAKIMTAINAKRGN